MLAVYKQTAAPLIVFFSIGFLTYCAYINDRGIVSRKYSLVGKQIYTVC